MHNGLGHLHETEYEWRPQWAQGRYSLPGGNLAGTPPRTVQEIRDSIRLRDAETCKRLLGQLPQTVDARHAQQQQQDERPRPALWEMAVPPYFCVAHEAVCGNDGAFAYLDSSALELVKFLHTNGAAMDAQDADGRTPLWIAADRGEVEVVRYLVNECGASANTRDLGGWTPLNAAVERCNEEAVSILVEDGKADVNTRDDRGYTPMHAVAHMGWLDHVKLLRKFGAEVDIPCEEDGETVLHIMARGDWTSHRYRRRYRGGRQGEVKRCSPIEGVKFLVGPLCKANVHARDNRERTPLLAAVQGSATRSEKFEIMRYLHEECGADVCVLNDSGSALHSAVSAESLEVVRYLIERGANPQESDNFGDTPLHELFHYMPLCGDKVSLCCDIARFLTSKECSSVSPNGFRADVNAQNDEGMTPLMLLLSANRRSDDFLQPFRLLLDELGAEVARVSSTNGNTALHICATDGYYGHWQDPKKALCLPVLERILAAEGVEIDARNNEGLTPLHAAIGVSQAETIIQYLLSRGASVHSAANNGRTPLHTAAALGKCKVAQMLVEAGAELDVPDSDGLSPVQLAELHTRKNPNLPEQFYYMMDDELRRTFLPVIKYLRGAGSTVPTWWTATNLVGRILSDKSQHALECFANATNDCLSSKATRRPHVAHIVHAQRLLEGASIHGAEVEDEIRDLVAAGDLECATVALMKVSVHKAVHKHSMCSICSETLTDEEEAAEQIPPVEQQEDAEKTPATHLASDNKDHCAREDTEKDTEHAKAEGVVGALLTSNSKEKETREENAQEIQQSEAENAASTACLPKMQLLSCPNLHPFHAGCLADLLLGGDFRCPVCRARIPIAATADMRLLLSDSENATGGESLLPELPQTIDGTMAAVEQRAWELESEEGNSDHRDRKSAVSREFLLRARDELLRSGQIDGALLARGPVALKANFLSSRQAFGVQVEADDYEPNGDAHEEDKGEEKETLDVNDPCFAACIGFGRGLLDPRVQQSMLTGDLARFKIARKTAQQKLVELRVPQSSAKGDEEQEEDSEDVILASSSINMRQAQAKLRKQRAKKDRRQRGCIAVPIVKPTYLGRRELSERSEQVVKALNVNVGDGDGDGGSTIADASRGHRYLELAAPVAGAKEAPLPAHMNPINTRSKAALREAVSEGDVDSAARHLRRSRISAHMEHVGTKSFADSETINEGTPTVIGSKGIRKKQRKRLAKLRRRQMIVDKANTLGHPVCCCCDSMVTSASLKPPSENISSASIATVSMQLAAESIAAHHSACVNGHVMHAACFLQLVTAALPCPSCHEPLVAPPVIRSGGEDNNCCAGGGGRRDPGEDDAEDAQLDGRLDFMAVFGLRFDDENEYGTLLDREDGTSDDKSPLADLRQCPGCHVGPLYNQDCEDLNYHHGECQKCGMRVLSRSRVDKIVTESLATQRKDRKKKMLGMDGSKDGESKIELSVAKALPQCKACQSRGITSKVWYNGCMSCGMSFASIPWDSLPPYEPPPEMYEGSDCLNKVHIPRRRMYTERVRRERRAVRLVAALEEQLHDEAVSFLHEKRALVDEQRRQATKQAGGTSSSDDSYP